MNCPGCDSSAFSIEVGPTGMGQLAPLVARADEAERIELVRTCWTCGWRETRVVSVESITVEPGDEQVAARERLMNELIAVASELDSADLETALTAVEERTESVE